MELLLAYRHDLETTGTEQHSSAVYAAVRLDHGMSDRAVPYEDAIVLKAKLESKFPGFKVAICLR